MLQKSLSRPDLGRNQFFELDGAAASRAQGRSTRSR